MPENEDTNSIISLSIISSLIYVARRLLAVLVEQWTILDFEKSDKSILLMNEKENFDALAKMTRHIEPNPRQFRYDHDGRAYIPRCGYREIVSRLHEHCEKSDLVILDPLAMLSFEDGGRDEWKGQEVFAKDAASIAAQTGSRLLVVHHSRKTAPGGRPRSSGLDEVAGAAALSRFADNVIFLEHNSDGSESEIVSSLGITSIQFHKRTLCIAKARDGRGTGWRIACDLGDRGPVLVEHGFIRKKARW